MIVDGVERRAETGAQIDLITQQREPTGFAIQTHRKSQEVESRAVKVVEAALPFGGSGLRFVQTNGGFADVKEDEMLGFVCHKGAEITTDNAMPSRSIFLIEEGLNVFGDVLFFRVGLQGGRYHCECVMLHVTVIVHYLTDINSQCK